MSKDMTDASDIKEFDDERDDDFEKAADAQSDVLSAMSPEEEDEKEDDGLSIVSHHRTGASSSGGKQRLEDSHHDVDHNALSRARRARRLCREPPSHPSALAQTTQPTVTQQSYIEIARRTCDVVEKRCGNTLGRREKEGISSPRKARVRSRNPG
jgi:hypothetical protein